MSSIHFDQPTPPQVDSTCDGAEARNDFWSVSGDFICRHHVEPRVKLHVPKEEPCLIPLKNMDVSRTTHTSLDVLLEKNTLMIIGTWTEKKNYQMHGQTSHVSFFWSKGYMTDTNCLDGHKRGKKQSQDPTMHNQIRGSICLMQQKAKQSKNGLSRNQSSISSNNWKKYSSLNQATRNSNTSWKTLVES